METTTITKLSTPQTVIGGLAQRLNQKILGQGLLTERLLIALLCDGHLLVEGAPGLAKTKAIKELAAGIEAEFHRIQFTPDLLPGDITGTDIYRPQTGEFIFQKGPIFHNLILADEINRAPAKVQSALLEAMAERQVTIGKKTYPLPPLFLVMATQNPIEQEGTYVLPEAQLDRFLMYVTISYPDAEVEKQILKLVRDEAQLTERSSEAQTPRVSEKIIMQARQEILNLHMSDSIEEYIVQLIMAMRQPQNYDKAMARWLRYGPSPRGAIALDRCARAHAWLHHRDYVSPADIHAIVHDVLRHRIILSFEAEAENISTDDFIDKLLAIVPIP